MTVSLFEIEVAARLGYRRWAEFRRAMRENKVPPPTRIEGNLMMWSSAAVDAWIEGHDMQEPTTDDLLERVRAG